MNEVEMFLRNSSAKQDFAHWAKNYQTMEDVWDSLMNGIPEQENEGEEWRNCKAREWALWLLSREGVLTGKERLNLAIRFAELYLHNKPLFSRRWEENCSFIKKIFQGEEFSECEMEKCIYDSYTDYIKTTAESAGIPYYILSSYFKPEFLVDAAFCCLNAAYELAFEEFSDDPVLSRFSTNTAGNAWDEELSRQFKIIQSLNNPFKKYCDKEGNKK